MKTYQKRKIRRERRCGDKETQSFAWLVMWRRLDNVQIREASKHAQIPVEYCVKTSYWNAKLHVDKNKYLTPLKAVELGSLVHVQDV